MDSQTLKTGIQSKIRCLPRFSVDEQDVAEATVKAEYFKSLNIIMFAPYNVEVRFFSSQEAPVL